MSNETASQTEETRIALGRYSRRKGKETRTKILTLLKNQPLTHKQLLETVGITASALTPHLKKLKSEGLIEQVAREGKVFYQVKSEKTAIEEFVNFIIDIIKGLNMGDLYPEYEEIIREALIADQKKRSEEIEEVLKKYGTSSEKLKETVKELKAESEKLEEEIKKRKEKPK